MNITTLVTLLQTSSSLDGGVINAFTNKSKEGQADIGAIHEMYCLLSYLLDKSKNLIQGINHSELKEGIYHHNNYIFCILSISTNELPLYTFWTTGLFTQNFKQYSTLSGLFLFSFNVIGNKLVPMPYLYFMLENDIMRTIPIMPFQSLNSTLDTDFDYVYDGLIQLKDNFNFAVSSDVLDALKEQQSPIQKI